MKRVRKFKTGFVAILSAIILGTAVGGTLAYIITQTDAVENTFIPGKVEGVVHETFTGSTKKDITVENKSDTSVYVRVAIVANWCDSNHSIIEPWNSSSFDAVLNGDAWIKCSDGYYYYKVPVEAGSFTQSLVNEKGFTPSQVGNLNLEMDIIAQVIQSTPADAVRAAWRVNVNNDGEITGKITG